MPLIQYACLPTARMEMFYSAMRYQMCIRDSFTGAEYQEGYEPFAIAQRAGAGGKGEAARGPAAGFLMIVIPVAIGQARLAQIHLGRVVEIVVDHALDVRIRHAAVVAVEIFAEFKIIVAVAPQMCIRDSAHIS